MTISTITITKLDAARRQLRTALELWFAEGDPVAIHTLSFAAHEIIHVVLRRKGGSNLLFDSVFIKDEYRKDFNVMIKSDSSFFKHARDDYNSEHQFDPGRNFVFLLMATLGLDRMGETLSDAEAGFILWNYIHNPHWFTPKVGDNCIPVELLQKLSRVDKSNFYQAFLLLRREGRL